MTNGTTLEITPTLGVEATRLRTVIAPDLAVFGIGADAHPNWIAENIDNVMRWCDLRPRVSFNPVLIVAAPSHGYFRYTMSGFAKAWEEWMCHANSVYGVVAVEMIHDKGDGTRPEKNHFWYPTGSEAVVQFYPKEFIDRAKDAPHADPWWHIISRALPCSQRSWFSDPDACILERFAHGDIHVEVDSFDDPADDQLGEVLVLNRAPTGEVTARAFMIPRVWDPSGHLP